MYQLQQSTCPKIQWEFILWAFRLDVILFQKLMDRLIDKSILDLPDEVIELVMDFLSLTDIMNLSTAGSKFADCAKRVLKRKTFSK